MQPPSRCTWGTWTRGQGVDNVDVTKIWSHNSQYFPDHNPFYLLQKKFYKKIIVAAFRNSNAGTMIATYTISCWCTRKTAQNKQLTGYVLWKICECERTRDSRLLLSDVSPQDCDQGQVSWWPGGQDQDPGNERPSPTSGDCLVTAVDTSLSPLPLRCCWIRNLRSSELRLALGASSQHWHSPGYSNSTPAISNVAVHWRFSYKFSKIQQNNSSMYIYYTMQNIYSSPCRLLLVKHRT